LISLGELGDHRLQSLWLESGNLFLDLVSNVGEECWNYFDAKLYSEIMMFFSIYLDKDCLSFELLCKDLKVGPHHPTGSAIIPAEVKENGEFT